MGSGLEKEKEKTVHLSEASTGVRARTSAQLQLLEPLLPRSNCAGSTKVHWQATREESRLTFIVCS